MPCLCCEIEETALTDSMRTAQCCQRVCKTSKMTILQQSATVTQYCEGASGQESATNDSILTGQLQWTTAVPTRRSALQRCADWSGRVPGVAQLTLPAVAKSARTVRSAHALQRPVSSTVHVTQLDQTDLGAEERADVQLPVVGRQRGGYSHQPADSSHSPWRSCRRRASARTVHHGVNAPAKHDERQFRTKPHLARRLPGSLAPNLAEQRSAPNFATPRYASWATSSCSRGRLNYCGSYTTAAPSTRPPACALRTECI